MKKIFIWLLLMMAMASPSYAQTYSATHIISASCPDESTGKSHTICYETTTEKFYQCVPDDNLCDKPSEWVIASVTFDTSQELADILTDETGSGAGGLFGMKAVFSIDPLIENSDTDSGPTIIGKVQRSAGAIGGILVADDDCGHGDDGKNWFDDNQSRTEFCEPNSPLYPLPVTFEDFVLRPTSHGVHSSTDNAIALWDGTEGNFLQDSLASVDDSGNITATNLSGTNTGDQDLSAYALTSALSNLVTGPATATDNAIARYNGTTGKIIQDSSGVTIDDQQNMVIAGSLNINGTLTVGTLTTEVPNSRFRVGVTNTNKKGLVVQMPAGTTETAFEIQNEIGTPRAKFNTTGNGALVLNYSGTMAPATYPGYVLSVQNIGDSGEGSWIEILNSGGANQGAFLGMYGDQFQMFNWQGGDIEFYTYPTASNSLLRMVIKDTGFVGIGTSTPQGILDLNSTSSALRVTRLANPSTISPARNGMIAYDSTDNELQGYINGSWVNLVSTGGGGDVVGPVSSTDNAITRFDSTTGKLIQNSGAILDDSNNITGDGNMEVIGGTAANSTLKLSANSASSGNTAGSIAVEVRTGNSGATKAITILQDGKVGIGTTTTAQVNNPLVVNGSVKILSALAGGVLIKRDNSPRWIEDTNSNVFIGGSGSTSVAGIQNFGLGSGSLLSLANGNSNVAIGTQSLPSITDGNNNTAIGSGIQAFYLAPTQESNTFVGAQVNFQGSIGATGGYSTIVGAFGAPYAEGDYLTFIGAHDVFGGLGLISGSHNIGIGYSPIIDSSDPSYVIAIGDEAGRYGSGSHATYIGHGVDGTSTDYEFIIGDGSSKLLTGKFNTKSVGIDIAPASITARLHLPAGTTSASSAPLKLTSGSLMTSPEAGAIEFLTNGLYYTQTTGPTRQQIASLAGTETFTNKTLTTPTIASFVNANHTHENSAGGGQLNATNVFSAGQISRARGGTGADTSAYGAGLFGSDGSNNTIDVDTEAELETALGGLDVITVTAGDITSANLSTALSDETGTGLAVFADDAVINVDGGTLEIPNSTLLPATCIIGQIYADVDATSGQMIYLCETTDNWVLQSGGGGGGSGDVVGPASATDNAITRFDGTTGKLVQNSAVTIDDSGNIDLQNSVAGETKGFLYKNAGRFLHTYFGGTSTGSNIFLGKDAGNFTMSSSGTLGSYMIGIGEESLNVVTTADSNICIGYKTCTTMTTGDSNVAVGHYALTKSVDDDENVAIGFEAGKNVSDEKNVFVGFKAGKGGVGVGSGISQSVVIGSGAGTLMTTATQNVILGYLSGAALTTGDNNTFLGMSTGFNTTTGSDNIMIGFGATATSSTSSDQLNIGDLIYGDLSSAEGVGINLPGPNIDALLHIAAGSATAGTAPLKFNTGTLLTTPERGAIEYLGAYFYATPTSTAVRQVVNTFGERALTDGATVALDASLGSVFNLSAAGDRTILTPTNPIAGKRIIIAHTASGGNRTLALTTGSAGAFRFGTTIAALTITTSGTTDYIECVYNSGADRWDVIGYNKGF